MPARGLPGFRDFYPDDITLRNHIFAAWRSVASRYGFEEYDGPPLEPLELYTEKSGQEIVAQLYEFTDKGDRRVALRPEMTPTLARMVTARAGALKKPIRWYSTPQLYRYERQQRGRLREHFQLNLDLIGEPGPLGDAEVIAAAIDVMRELGLGAPDVRARLSDRRVMEALLGAAGVRPAHVRFAYWAIDRMEKDRRGALAEQLVRWLTEDETPMPADEARRTADAVLGFGEVRGISGFRSALKARGVDERVVEPLDECVQALDQMGLGPFVEVDASVVRGLAYYTGIVFELFDAHGAFRAICGGGRYDGLLKALGGADLPAVGFGMGDVVLGELIRARGLHLPAAPALDAFLVAVTSEDQPTVLRLAHELRDRGARVEFALKQQSIGKQLSLAAARRARLAIVIGPDERAKGVVVRRNLATGEEDRVAIGALLEQVGDSAQSRTGGGTGAAASSSAQH
jgi:histidyl-tRNA synthetase